MRPTTSLDLMNTEIIEVKYHADITPLEKFSYGDWVDLRAAETVVLKKGESKLISLGVSMRLPEGYEAHIVPRSSTFSKWKILQANHFGVIDNSYSGDTDIWKFLAIAVEDTTIEKNDRICQFRIVNKQPELLFRTVEHLDSPDRGGFGSTGTN